MKLRGLTNLIASTAIGVSSFLSSQTASAMNPADGNVEKYALIINGDSRGEKGIFLEDPIDKNFGWLGSVGTYKKLQEMGFEHENMYFLYDDGNPDFLEEKYKETIEFIKEHEFNEPRKDKKATIANLEKAINELSKKVDEDDIFVFAINTHGSYNLISMEGGVLYDSKLDALLERIEPGIGLACIDACHSGYFIKQLSLDNYVVLSATDDQVAWGDRNYGFNRLFLQNLMDAENDTDHNGKVSINESYTATDKEAKEYWKGALPWLKENYQGDREGLGEVTFNPQIVIGANASGDWAISKKSNRPKYPEGDE